MLSHSINLIPLNHQVQNRDQEIFSLDFRIYHTQKTHTSVVSIILIESCLI